MKRMLACALCLALALCAFGAIAAQGSEKESRVVRVGWYESAFHRTDSFGRRSGYGYEYQQRIATYTGWTYEYVEGSWSELFEKLVAGEIDLLSDVSYTAERAEKILYSAEVMGSEDYHVFIAPDNTEISPDDFSTFNGKRVGVNKNSIQEQMFSEWADSHGVQPEIVELTEKTPQLLEMLARGEIDALVTLDTYGRQADVVPVCKVGYAESYFGINRNKPEVKRELDVAMNRLLEENREFNQQLMVKFNEASSISNFLTKEEVDWLSDHGTIRVGYRDDYLPFCDLDENTSALTGALSDYLSFAETAEKNARLSFEAHAYDSTEKALKALSAGEIDCVFPVSLSSYDGEQIGVVVTDPYVKTEMYALVRTADQQGVSKDREMKVAIVSGTPNFEIFVMDNFPNWQATHYEDVARACQMVASGDEDCTLVNSYRLSRVAELCEKYKLSTLTTGESMDMSFAVRRQDDCLYSILNKINRLIPASTTNAVLNSYAFSKNRVTFGEFLRDNLIAVVAGISLVAVAILLLLLRNVRVEMKASEGRRLISEAERDQMTGLYNRDFFTVYANRRFREHPDKPMDAICVNIEGFRSLNALNGHDFGDGVLRALGDEINAFLKKAGGIAGRMEADHFDIYCDHCDDYAAVLGRLQARMDADYPGVDIRLRAGVMPWQRDVAPEQMFDLARSACGMVRGNYKNHLMVYDEAMRARDEYNKTLKNDIAKALEDGALQVYYQPKYDIQSQPAKLNSAEALVRWNHPTLGLISPSDFIPLFERSGQISAVDNYVWAEAARQIAAWRDKYGVSLPVSVNLSRVDVFDPNLMSILDGLVEKYGLERRQLLLEVTESAYTENADQLIRIIKQLRDKGYEIEMDDFGSGYSSLNMLSSMPIDVLKMDMAFIQNIERNEKDFRLVELILDIARYLKVPVIAEGVETPAQLKLLKDAGCDLVQGYYFSRPLSATDFEREILGIGKDRGEARW